jgi:hypothetical protein
MPLRALHGCTGDVGKGCCGVYCEASSAGDSLNLEKLTVMSKFVGNEKQQMRSYDWLLSLKADQRKVGHAGLSSGLYTVVLQALPGTAISGRKHWIPFDLQS